MSDDKAKDASGSDASDKARRIRDKISASQARARGDGGPRKPAPARRKPADGNASQGNFFARALEEHPVALLAGSVVLGAVAASLVPASVGRKLGSRMLGLAALAGDFGASYGGRAWGLAARGARAGQERLDGFGEAITDRGEDARRRAIEMGTLAGRRAIELAETAAANARDARETAFKRIGDLSAKVRN